MARNETSAIRMIARKLLQTDPRDPAAVFALGWATHLDGGTPQAKSMIMRALQLESGIAERYCALAKILIAEGDADSALALLKLAYGSDPDHPQTRYWLGHLLGPEAIPNPISTPPTDDPARGDVPSVPLETVMQAFDRLNAEIEGWARPPADIPDSLRDAFTMNGRVPVRHVYRDDTLVTLDGESGAAPRVSINFAQIFYPHDKIKQTMERAIAREPQAYGETDLWLYRALESHPVDGGTVAVFGSGHPVYEGIVLAFGGHPLAVEYQVRFCPDSRLRYVTPDEFLRSGEPVDAGISVSSFEHDGLGRYGDPIDPDGDLKTMRRIKARFRPGGTLFLSVPIGPDALVWNVNRIYGPIRLPRLLADWRVIDVIGPPPRLFRGLAPFEIDDAEWDAFWDGADPGFAPEWMFVLRTP